VGLAGNVTRGRVRLDEKQCFYREVILWKHLSCPYIDEFNGVFYHNGMLAIVTPWAPQGTITEYLEKHPDADRLGLVSLNVPPAPSHSSLCTCHNVAFRCGERGQVPPRPQHSPWGHQRGESSNPHGGPDHETVVFPVKRSHFKLHHAPSHAHRPLFHPRGGRLHGIVKRGPMYTFLHGSRTPPPDQIRSSGRSTIQGSGYLRFGHDNLPSLDG